MPDLVLDLLNIAFLIVLYIFVARAVRATIVEMRPEAPARASRQTRSAPPPKRASKKLPRKAVIVEGASKSGKSFDLNGELVLGRGERCHIVLDDTYVSNVHARIFDKDGRVLVEDLGSTNGTYLNRRRITSPMELHRGDQVKVGKTVLELRR